MFAKARNLWRWAHRWLQALCNLCWCSLWERTCGTWYPCLPCGESCHLFFSLVSRFEGRRAHRDSSDRYPGSDSKEVRLRFNWLDLEASIRLALSTRQTKHTKRTKHFTLWGMPRRIWQSQMYGSVFNKSTRLDLNPQDQIWITPCLVQIVWLMFSIVIPFHTFHTAQSVHIGCQSWFRQAYEWGLDQHVGCGWSPTSSKPNASQPSGCVGISRDVFGGEWDDFRILKTDFDCDE